MYIEGGGVKQGRGIKSVLSERGLFDERLHLEFKHCAALEIGPRRELCARNRCCHRAILSSEPDFKAQREWLREVIEDLGCKIIFLPTFHCELNFIERVWSDTKCKCRRACVQIRRTEGYGTWFIG